MFAYKKLLGVTILCLLLFPAVKNLIRWEFYDTHDGIEHIQRFYYFDKSISNGQIIPRWAADAFAGYGTPIFNFSWNLPYYIGYLIHQLGFSYITVLNILMIIGLAGSGLTMYFWLKDKFGTVPAFTAAIFYVYAPYRFLDVNVRGALGENILFIFIPLVFYFIDRIADKNTSKNIFLGSIFLAATILSHNGLALIMIGVYATYIIGTYTNKNTLLSQIVLLIGGLGLSSFLWLPAALENKFIAYHDVSQKLSFVPFFAYIRSRWEGGTIIAGQKLLMSFEIGIPQLTIIVISLLLIIFFLLKRKEKFSQLKFAIFFIVWFLISIFLLSPLSTPIWQHVPLLNNFVFTWRMLFMTVLTTAILSAWIVKRLPYKKIIAILLISFTLYANRNHLIIQNKNISVRELIKEQPSLDVWGEFLPKWSNYKMLKYNYYKSSNDEIKIIGSGQIVNVDRKDLITVAEFKINTPSLVQFHRLYYPAWSLSVDGKEQKILYDKPEYGGTVVTRIQPGKHQVVLQFKNTLPMTLGNMLSILTLLYFLEELLLKKLC